VKRARPRIWWHLNCSHFSPDTKKSRLQMRPILYKAHISLATKLSAVMSIYNLFFIRSSIGTRDES
jgi:hypothetical protein